MTHPLRPSIIRRTAALVAAASVAAVAGPLLSSAGAAAGTSPPTTTLQAPPASLISVPNAPGVDLTKWAVPVAQQGSAGSCTTWAIAYAMLGWYSRHDGVSGQPFAPMYVYSQAHSTEPDGSDGGASPTDVLNLLKEQGVDTRADYGHTDTDWLSQPTAAQRANAAHWKVKDFHQIFKRVGSEDPTATIKAQLDAGKPVAIRMTARAGIHHYYMDGKAIYNDTTGTNIGGHSVLALGYDSTGLLIQNSWGTSWGINGFARLSWAVVAKDIQEANTIDGFLSGSPGAGPAASTSITSVSTGTNMTSLYQVDANGTPWAQDFTKATNKWSGWSMLHAYGKVSPGATISAVPDNTGGVELFTLGEANQLWRGREVPGAVNTFTGWMNIHSGDKVFPVGSKITAISARPGEMSLYVLGSDGRVWTDYRLAGSTTWHGWVALGNNTFPAGSKITALSNAVGATSLYIVGSDGKVWTQYFPTGGTAWSGWFTLGATIFPVRSTVAALSLSPGATSLYVTGQSGQVWSQYFPAGGSAWSGWFTLGGALAKSDVRAVSTGPGATSLYMAGTDGKIWTEYFPTGGTAWSGWYKV